MNQRRITPTLLVIILIVSAMLLTACRKDLGNELPDLNPNAALDNALPVIELPVENSGESAYPVVAPDLTTLDTTATGEQPVENTEQAVPESAPAQDASVDNSAEQAPAEQPAEQQQPADNSAEQAPAEQPAQSTEQATVIHVVQAGETVGTIADRYGVTIDDILAANDIFNVNLISIGQELRIESGAALQVQQQQTQQSGGTGYDPNNYFIHTVGFGDTMFVLAQRYGFTVEELAAYNGIVNYDRIDLNQEIRIPNR